MSGLQYSTPHVKDGGSGASDDKQLKQVRFLNSLTTTQDL